MTKPITATPTEHPDLRIGSGFSPFITFKITYQDGSNKTLHIKASNDYKKVLEASIITDGSFTPIERETDCAEGSWQTTLLQSWRTHFLNGDFLARHLVTFKLREQAGGFTYALTANDQSAVSRRKLLISSPYDQVDGDSFEEYCAKQRILQLGTELGFRAPTTTRQATQHWLIRFLPELSGGLLFLAGIALLMNPTTPVALVVGLIAAGIGLFSGSQLRTRFPTAVQETSARPSIQL